MLARENEWVLRLYLQAVKVYISRCSNLLKHAQQSIHTPSSLCFPCFTAFESTTFSKQSWAGRTMYGSINCALKPLKQSEFNYYMNIITLITFETMFFVVRCARDNKKRTQSVRSIRPEILTLLANCWLFKNLTCMLPFMKHTGTESHTSNSVSLHSNATSYLTNNLDLSPSTVCDTSLPPQ